MERTNAPEAWAIVELMGHVRLAGRISEEEKFGSKMGRLDIPLPPEKECPDCQLKGATCDDCRCRFVTQFFGGGSVYRITLVTEGVARHVAKGTTAAPVSSWDFPKQLQTASVVDDEPEFELRDDNGNRY